MILDTKFPYMLTHTSDQSTTQGARLNLLLGNKTPRSIIDNRVVFREVILELWHERACLTQRNLVHCLPFYMHYQAIEPEMADDPELPCSWQLQEELFYLLPGICESQEGGENLFANFGRKDIECLLQYCDVLEADNNEPVDEFRSMLQGLLI